MWHPTCLYGRWVYTESRCRHKRDKALNCRAQPSAEPGEGSSVPQHPQTQPREGSWGTQVISQNQKFLEKHNDHLWTSCLQFQTLWSRLHQPITSGEQLHPGWSQGCLLLQQYFKWVIENQKAAKTWSFPSALILPTCWKDSPQVWLCWPGQLARSPLYPVCSEGKGNWWAVPVSAHPSLVNSWALS